MKRETSRIVVFLCAAIASSCASHQSQISDESICASNPSSPALLWFGLEFGREKECLVNGAVLTCEIFNEGDAIDDDARRACRKYAEATQLYLSRRFSNLVSIPLDRVIDYRERTPCESFSVDGLEQGSCAPRIEAVIPFDSVKGVVRSPSIAPESTRSADAAVVPRR